VPGGHSHPGDGYDYGSDGGNGGGYGGEVPQARGGYDGPPCGMPRDERGRYEVMPARARSYGTDGGYEHAPRQGPAGRRSGGPSPDLLPARTAPWRRRHAPPPDDGRWDDEMWRDDRWQTGPAVPGLLDEAQRRRRRRLAVGVGAVGVLVAVLVAVRPSGVVDAGRAMGVLTGDVATVPGIGVPAAAGAVGEASRGGGDGGSVAAGPDATIVVPGPDGVVGSDDDLVIPSGSARTGAPGASSSTTVTTGPTSSTSTTLPPIPVDLAVTKVDVPATSEDSTDGCGSNVDFDAPLLADGQSDTAWRMDGDGSGQSLTLHLDGSHRVVSVGLIPGYARVDPCDGTARFTQNRRITKVTWQFDDGTTVAQALSDSAEMQMVAVSAEASTVTLHIDGVTGEPERDFTAISEVDVRGT
jgi:hypothetical protein